MSENNNKMQDPVVTPTQVTPRVKKEYDSTDNKQRGYKYFWEVYPADWGKTWGSKPMLGYVRADSEYNAYYAAYDKGFAYLWNFPFGVEVSKATKFVRFV